MIVLNEETMMVMLGRGLTRTGKMCRERVPISSHGPAESDGQSGNITLSTSTLSEPCHFSQSCPTACCVSYLEGPRSCLHLGPSEPAWVISQESIATSPCDGRARLRYARQRRGLSNIATASHSDISFLLPRLTISIYNPRVHRLSSTHWVEIWVTHSVSFGIYYGSPKLLSPSSGLPLAAVKLCY